MGLFGFPLVKLHLYLFLGANLLANFSIAFTYETVITIGVILAVPLCAGKKSRLKLLTSTEYKK